MLPSVCGILLYLVAGLAIVLYVLLRWPDRADTRPHGNDEIVAFFLVAVVLWPMLWGGELLHRIRQENKIRRRNR